MNKESESESESVGASEIVCSKRSRWYVCGVESSSIKKIYWLFFKLCVYIYIEGQWHSAVSLCACAWEMRVPQWDKREEGEYHSLQLYCLWSVILV